MAKSSDRNRLEVVCIEISYKPRVATVLPWLGLAVPQYLTRHSRSERQLPSFLFQTVLHDSRLPYWNGTTHLPLRLRTMILTTSEYNTGTGTAYLST